MRIHARLKKLEKHARHHATCPDCGCPLDGSVPKDVKLVVRPPAVIDFNQPPPVIDTSKDLCRTCGARLVFRIVAPRPLAV